MLLPGAAIKLVGGLERVLWGGEEPESLCQAGGCVALKLLVRASGFGTARPCSPSPALHPQPGTFPLLSLEIAFLSIKSFKSALAVFVGVI